MNKIFIALVLAVVMSGNVFSNSEKQIKIEDIKIIFPDIIKDNENFTNRERKEITLKKTQSGTDFIMWNELCSELNDNSYKLKRNSSEYFFYKNNCESWHKRNRTDLGIFKGLFGTKTNKIEDLKHIRNISKDIESYKSFCLTPDIQKKICKKLNFPIWNEDGVMTTDEKLDLIIWQNKKNEAMRLADKFWDNEIAKKKAMKKKGVIYDDSFLIDEQKDDKKWSGKIEFKDLKDKTMVVLETLIIVKSCHKKI